MIILQHRLKTLYTAATLFHVVLLNFILSGCGSSGLSLKTKQELNIIVLGTYTEPEEVLGNATPVYYTMIFSKAVLTDSDGETHEFVNDNPVETKIVDRDQIIFTDSLSDYTDKTFVQAEITFLPDIVVGGKYAEIKSTLTPYIFSSEAIKTIKKSSSMDLRVKILWKNTLERDEENATETFYQPEFSITVD